jgi:hypothetical protein
MRRSSGLANQCTYLTTRTAQTPMSRGVKLTKGLPSLRHFRDILVLPFIGTIINNTASHSRHQLDYSIAYLGGEIQGYQSNAWNFCLGRNFINAHRSNINILSWIILSLNIIIIVIVSLHQHPSPERFDVGDPSKDDADLFRHTS